MESGVQTLSPSDVSPVKAKSPWGTPHSTPAPCSLSAVMDEELARRAQNEEDKAYKRAVLASTTLPTSTPSLLSAPTPPPDTSDDLLLAQMLQLEFDKEHDLMLTAEEKHVNKHSRVHVSFENYRSLHPSLLDDEVAGNIADDEDEEQQRDNGYATGRVATGDVQVSRGRRRSKGVPVGKPTKHDPEVCGRKNARNMEKFPPDFPCGDLDDGKADIRLPNAVFNTLKLHSHKENRHAQRLHEKKEHSTVEQALDAKTKLMLFKMVDSGLLAEVNGCISTGKEACVYHAEGGSPEDRTVPPECAIKVFKTTLNEFKTRDRYIKDDYRFKERFSKQNPRKIVKLWAEKEMHNLRRLQEGGILCPEVVLLRKHVLIMSFIGQDMSPAPQLREAKLSHNQMESAYQQCTQAMKTMYSTCHLVHADLSEYNMLWYKSKVYFIDVSQSVEPSHPHGLEFLFRDCTNVTNFFNKTGLVSEVMTSHQLFNFVTGLDIRAATDEELLIQISTHRQRLQHHKAIHSRTDYPFDYFFEQTSKTTPTSGDKTTSSDSSEEEVTVGNQTTPPFQGSQLET